MMAFDHRYPNTSATDRGWGPMWRPGDPIGQRPASFPGDIVPLVVDGVSFVGGIREELAELAGLLILESLERRYIPKLDDPGCWGGAFRPTKRSDGSYTTTPSNHSSYTALDINAPHNVFGASTHQIKQPMADLWKRYGWRWLGPPIKDWMHFDFAGEPADARRMLDRARRELGEDEMTKEQLAKLRESDLRWEGALAFAAQDDPFAEPPKDRPKAWKEGFRFARRLVRLDGVPEPA